MADRPIVNIVTTQCLAQDESRFNKWYNEVHIPMLMKYKGVKAVARYKTTSEKSEKPMFIAVYKFNSAKDFENFGKSPEFAAAIAEMKQSWPQGIEIVGRAQHELIQEW
ncbi:MAG TPA: EthD family reductase [Dehalococcoidales bacterium]|jgi:uncharacterized protein (TIGR02118 family)